MDDVHVGQDGWLYLQTGSNIVLSLLTDPGTYPEALHDAWVSLLMERSRRLVALGVQYVHIVAPDKLSVFPEFYGDGTSNFSAAPLARLTRERLIHGEPACLLDPTTVLHDAKGTLPSFFKTDSHWTIFGAHLVCQQICRHLGVDPSFDFTKQTIGRSSVVFDLGEKLSPTVAETNFYMPSSATISRVHANARVLQREEAERTQTPAAGHHGCHIVLHNSAGHVRNEVVVLFGDSFSDYRPSSLTWLLAEEFSDVHFIWSAGLDFDYVQRVSATIVVSELAERFMSRLPQDDVIVEA